MNTHIDLSSLRQEWQAHDAAPQIDPQRWIAEGTRRMRIGLFAPVAVTIIAGGSTSFAALSSRQPGLWALASGVWIFICIAWLGSLWIARNTWRPFAETTAAYVQLSILRCRSSLRAMRFGQWLYAIGLLAMIIWKRRYLAGDLASVMTSWPVLIYVFVVTPAVYATLRNLASKKRAQLDYFLELERQIEGR